MSDYSSVRLVLSRFFLAIILSSGTPMIAAMRPSLTPAMTPLHHADLQFALVPHHREERGDAAEGDERGDKGEHGEGGGLLVGEDPLADPRAVDGSRPVMKPQKKCPIVQSKPEAPTADHVGQKVPEARGDRRGSGPKSAPTMTMTTARG